MYWYKSLAITLQSLNNHCNPKPNKKSYNPISLLSYSIQLANYLRKLLVKKCNMLAFNIVQFFSLLNHHILSSILDKVGFDPKISIFFWNYLVSRKTKYFWNSFSSSFFQCWYWSRTGLSPFSNTVCLIPLFYFSHFWKIVKKSKNPNFHSFFCRQ